MSGPDAYDCMPRHPCVDVQEVEDPGTPSFAARRESVDSSDSRCYGFYSENPKPVGPFWKSLGAEVEKLVLNPARKHCYSDSFKEQKELKSCIKHSRLASA